MKKKLLSVAVASVLAAPVAALAQSSVSISGLVDLGYRSANAPANGAGVQSGDVRSVAHNGSATTAIIISGTEQVQPGLKAIFRYEMNPDFNLGAGLTGGAGGTPGGVATTAAGGAISLGGGANGYSFLGLEGGFGKVLMGRLNSPTLGVWGLASVFGTALGSGYAHNGKIFTSYSASTANYNNSAPTRFNGALEYTSPTMSGFTTRILYVPKVDKAGLGTNGICSTTACTAEEARGIGANRAGVSDLSLAYSAGPANLAIASQTINLGTNGMSALVTPTGRTDGKNRLNTIAGNYKIGSTTANLGWWEENDKTAAGVQTAKTKGYSVGATHVMGRFTYKGSVAKSDSTIATNYDGSIFGLGVDYELSKRTSLYGRFENRDANTNSGDDNSTHGVTKVWHAGVRHTF